MKDNMAYDEIKYNMHSIAFYNLENLFDLTDDKHTNDNDFLPISVKKWTPKRYDNNLRKLGYAISNIGKTETGKHPDLVGLAEVENAKVIEDLINSQHLQDYNYSYVHYDSPDERGIDVALLYNPNAFKVINSETFSIELTNEKGLPDYTRDILLVTGLLDEEEIHIIINHWASRREGEKETEFKRLASSNKVGEIILRLRLQYEDPKIVVIGDFNDEPHNKSIKQLLDGFELHNPMASIRSYSRGSTYHNRKWNLFDQILLSVNFLKSSNHSLELYKANIFDKDFLKLFNGPYKGSPFRTYVGKKYKGGYSDHFPVYAVFKK